MSSRPKKEWFVPFDRKIMHARDRFQVEVNSVVSPHEIWVTLKEDIGRRDEILDFLNSPDFLESSKTVEAGVRQYPPYRPGMACIAKMADWGVWVRAETTTLDSGRWGVRLVDYGDAFAVSSSLLRLVPRHSPIMDTPALAMKTSLDNVGWRDGDGCWSEAVVKQLRRYLEHVKDIEFIQSGLREEGEDVYWLKYLVDFTVTGGGKSATGGKALTSAFIYEGHAVYTTHPDRKLVVGGLLKASTQWDFAPLPSVLLPNNEINRIKVTIGNYDQRMGKLAVCVDDEETQVRKIRVARLLDQHFVLEGDRARVMAPFQVSRGTIGVVRMERGREDGGGMEVAYYRAQIRGIVGGSLPHYNLYMVDEAVELEGIRADAFLECPRDLLAEAPLAIPTALHAFHNPINVVRAGDGRVSHTIASKIENYMDNILRHYVSKEGVVTMKIMTVNQTELEVVIYLAGFVHSLNDILLGFTGNERDKRWLEFLDHGGSLIDALAATDGINPHPYVDSFFKAENYRRAMEADSGMAFPMPSISEIPGAGRGTAALGGPQRPVPGAMQPQPYRPPNARRLAGGGQQQQQGFPTRILSRGEPQPLMGMDLDPPRNFPPPGARGYAFRR